DNIEKLSSDLVATGKWSRDALRFGLVTFRDHPPQDKTYIVQPHPFETDVNNLKSTLAKVVADGGGDGPEAQCEALDQAVRADWNDDAIKIAILVTDSPPHGIGEDGDKFPDGCPLQNDPLRLSKRMAKLGIILHVLACEPTLSLDFSTPLDFYKAITTITGGRLFPLADSKDLLPIILGGVLESHAVEGLVVKHKADICRQAIHGASADKISHDLHANLQSSGLKLSTFDVEDIYIQNEAGDSNVQTWLNADSIDERTLSKLQEVRGFRLQKSYRSNGGRPALKSHDQLVNIDQVKRAVTKSLVRNS
ncbi:unnamed protein product, partial [Rhizoctonia solani]